MSRSYRPANGRDPLPQPYNADFIPADPFGPRPTRTMSLPAALPENRSTKVTSRFNSETGELKIFLGFADPTAEKTAINQLITDAKKKGLRLITLFIESEVANELSTYVFLMRNKFTRNEGREGDTHGQLVWEKKIS